MTTTDENLVEVDEGVRLMIHHAGKGTPAVVCISCAGGAHEEWSGVAARLSPLAEVVTYGRPSLGGSDPLPPHLAGRTQTIQWTATQLRTLLHKADITPPYVLLTSSIGSWIADQYAALWPDEVAGMVLIDPTMASAWHQIKRESPLADGDDDRGCLRLTWDDSYAELARSVPPRQPRRVVISRSDGSWERNASQSAASQPKWYDPLTLPEVDLLWQASQREWVDRLSALHVVANTAGHFVHRDEPDLVAHVTVAVIDAARADKPVRLEADAVVATGGRVEPPGAS